jgi:hypothetical protein
MKYCETPRSFRTCMLCWGHVSGTFDEMCIHVGKVRETCPKVGGVGWEWPRAFGMLWNTSETFKVVLKCSESNIKVWRRPRVFGVCLQKCEWWLCLYEASCDVFSELGPVGGPINGTETNDTPPAPSLTSNCLWGGSWVEWQGGHHVHRTTTAPPTTTMSHCLWGGKGCYVRSTGRHHQHNAPLAFVRGAFVFIYIFLFILFVLHSFVCISYVVPLVFVRGVSVILLYNSKST